ncbi:hypothetical protein EYD45_01780 [Hyunsoonleella flava]|uniref:Putative auto-transporter adhesin head GIN domain-containing protein n=1 Tax=Hyunsoonleella flava TaxID=2527939 RepID=A0A4Q9FH65_9FLAO|nr:DUF2807 domain-containing protein [Hyunsoonleella flava]TBN06639.1 hypothetical protein EYD45_01780 [Hyunsoonleella flava]
MKNIIILLICIISFTVQAQIKGNKQIETRTFNFDGVTDIKIDLYAKITIDLSAKAGLSITTDSNLFDYIDKDINNGKIHFNQIKWIQPSQDIIITIGAPRLKKVFHDTHDITRIINVNNEALNVTAPIGEISIEGKTKELRLGSEQSKIDAIKIVAEKVFVNLWSRGTVKVFPTKYLWAKVSENGNLEYVNEPDSKTIKSYKNHTAPSDFTNLENPKFINFKIKNNSMNKNQFFVVGPKPDGTSFSYGFPMMPQATRKEYWTTGTKVYKVNKLGFRKLLVTITGDDENKTVKLF